ncbi:MAG: hypothetical protein AAGA77_02865 [Bacteroidota bacterium]
MAKDIYIPRDEIVDMNKEFDKVRDKVEKELMKLPDVLAVGVGLKETAGELKRELCFKVTVQKKKSKRSIKKDHRIPEEIFGFKTDVVEVVVSQPPTDRSKYRPLIGGCQIASSTKSGVGTLGCLAKRNSDNKIVLLTNWHVVVDNGAAVENERIGQPNHNGCCSCCATGEIAVVSAGFLDNTHDCAIAVLNGQEGDTIPEVRYINEILGIGAVAGSANPLGGETVFKYGRTTELTRGIITNDNTVIGVDFSDTYDGFGTITRPGVTVQGQPVGTSFIDFGDSGSVSVNELNQVVILNWAIQGGGRISQVETDLGITILDSSFPTTANKSGVPLGGTAISSTPIPAPHFLEQLQDQLNASATGRILSELFDIHQKEILALVRKNREVMTAWHRYQGPAYLSHMSISAKRNKPVPQEINGISLQNLLLKMTAVLKRNGSPELKQAVENNYLTVIEVFASGSKLEEWKRNLDELDNKLIDKTQIHA